MMDSFFLEYRDPLFSIIVFFALIFIITFFSYWWGRYKRKEDAHELERFLQKFQSVPTEDEIKLYVENGSLSEKLWLVLARAYSQTGEYEKSIEIYNELLQQCKSSDMHQLLFLLGKTYFKAGFLQRSQHIFIEILKKKPRTPQALHYLVLVYEAMGDLKAAKKTLEPLDELGEDVSAADAYFEAQMLIRDATVPQEKKLHKLLELNEKHAGVYRLVFEQLFLYDKALAWQHLRVENAEALIDILWHLEKKDVNFDIISQSSFLRELYTAKGYGEFCTSSTVFELDVLIHLNQHAAVTLGFEYLCQECKALSPFAFHRCSQCHALGEMEVELNLTRDYEKGFCEENNSFQ